MFPVHSETLLRFTVSIMGQLWPSYDIVMHQSVDEWHSCHNAYRALSMCIIISSVCCGFRRWIVTVHLNVAHACLCPAFRRLKLTSVIADPFSSVAGVHEWLWTINIDKETKAHSCDIEPRDTQSHTCSFTSNSLMQ